MIGRAVSAGILACIPMFLQLLLCSVGLVGMGIVLVAAGPGNALALWFGTAGVGLFATPGMYIYICLFTGVAAIYPSFYISLSLISAFPVFCRFFFFFYYILVCSRLLNLREIVEGLYFFFSLSVSMCVCVCVCL